jgi:DNA gyrase subunit A
MAKNKNTITTEVVDQIIENDFADVLDTSFTKYAFKVIEDRAIPDARDGLKPSQRRILVAMSDLNLWPDKKHLKCAKICGDTGGNYHPHGDAVIYPTLVNLAQPFGIRHPLIDPQGNFGSVDGDPPAALRYTEARLSRFGMAMVEELSKDTVDYKRNFDDRMDEPVVLPAIIPNLLMNGVSGIAVGYATNIPPHNYKELVDVFEAYAKNPNIQAKDIIKIMPGPDFPTGGRLLGQNSVLEYYETGRGSFKMEGVYSIETTKTGKDIIVITEFPAGGSPKLFREQIQDLVEKGKIGGISDCPDYSSKKIGTRVVVEIGKNGNAKVVLNQLLSHTCLRTSYSVNSTILINGKLYDKCPLTVIIKAFIDHRIDVITRKFKAEVADNTARIEILEGLIRVSSRIDETIKIIRASENPEEATKTLLEKEIIFTETQAKAVLSITLAKLTKLEQNNLLAEKNKREDRVKYLVATLGSSQDILNIIIQEQKNLSEKIGNARRTKIEASLTEIKDEDLITVEDVIVSISTDDCIKRVPLNLYKQQGRGGSGVKAADLKEETFIQAMFAASTHDDLLCFTDTGRVFKLKVFELPEGTRTSKGRPIINFINLKDKEKVCAYLPIKGLGKQQMFLNFISKQGIVKRAALREYAKINQGGIIATKVKDGDKIISVLPTKGIDDLLLITHLGSAIRFSELELRIGGRNSQGVIGMRLADKDYIVGGISVPMSIDSDADLVTTNADQTMMTLTSKGWGKRTNVDEYLIAPESGGKLRPQSRGSKGKMDISLENKIGLSVGIISLEKDTDIVVITKQGQMVRVNSSTIRPMNRGTNGSRLLKLSDGDEVIAASPVATEPEEDKSLKV